MLERIVITAFFVLAIWATMWEGAIFGFVRRIGQRWPEKLQKPVFDCPICMTAWYGSAAYWLIWHHNWQDWIIVVIGAMGFNAALVKLFPDD